MSAKCLSQGTVRDIDSRPFEFALGLGKKPAYTEGTLGRQLQLHKKRKKRGDEVGLPSIQYCLGESGRVEVTSGTCSGPKRHRSRPCLARQESEELEDMQYRRKPG